MSGRHPSERTQDSGDLKINPTHIGDGYYSVRCTCRSCGDEATTTLTVPKAKVKGIGDAWFAEHWHNP